MYIYIYVKWTLGFCLWDEECKRCTPSAALRPWTRSVTFFVTLYCGSSTIPAVVSRIYVFNCSDMRGLHTRHKMLSGDERSDQRGGHARLRSVKWTAHQKFQIRDSCSLSPMRCSPVVLQPYSIYITRVFKPWLHFASHRTATFSFALFTFKNVGTNNFTTG